MRFGSSVVAAFALSVVIAGLSACEKQEGPAERAGKKIDKAVEKVGDQVKKGGENIQDAAKNAKK
jgi:hypothetical protein